MQNTAFFRKRLVTWYRRSKRDLPWRHTQDPYKILVSEVMLQQTQVETVIPYYKRWLKQFPDFKSLAQAGEPAVLKLWQGLGYYRRAKMLHRNAQEVVTKYHGKLPENPETLLKLPGIGRYTAGAVASIAFNKKAALVDGNVIRILTRLFAISENVAEKETIERLWEIAESLLPEKNAGDFNQALMELGATVCFPRNPDCAHCPVSKSCAAFRLKKPGDFPVKSPGIKATKLKEFAFVLRDHKKRLLVKKQRAGERWQDLWTLPHFKKMADGLRFLKAKKSGLKKLRSDKHGFTRYQITLETFEAVSGAKIQGEPFRWATPREIKMMTFPAVYQKILSEVLS